MYCTLKVNVNHLDDMNDPHERIIHRGKCDSSIPITMQTVHALTHLPPEQSGKSPKVVALFLLLTLVAIL